VSGLGFTVCLLPKLLLAGGGRGGRRQFSTHMCGVGGGGAGNRDQSPHF
jgi:hypothetical protein